MDPAARGLNEHLDLQECTAEEYEESSRFVTEEDAIMDEDVFEHLKKITSYQYNRRFPDSITKSDFATTRALNREALNKLVEGYVGYAWLCEAAVEIMSLLDDTSDRNDSNYAIIPQQLLYQALCELLMGYYDTDKMRRYMDQRKGHVSWHPPQFYWQLMKHPTVASTILKLYHEKPKDEFFACWYQDYVQNYRCNGVSFGMLSNEELSKHTSNFSVFTLRMSEEIRRYLLKDDRSEVDDKNPDNICQLFCYAENAYFYSQALLHFIVRWRPDLSGCRRLSQLLCHNIMDPPTYWTDFNKREREYSAAHLNLLMTNLGKYERLNRIFRSILQNQVNGRLVLNQQELCEFCDVLQRILDNFECYQTLLYERPSVEKTSSRSSSWVGVGGVGGKVGSREFVDEKNLYKKRILEVTDDGFSIPDRLSFIPKKMKNVEEKEVMEYGEEQELDEEVDSEMYAEVYYGGDEERRRHAEEEYGSRRMRNTMDSYDEDVSEYNEEMVDEEPMPYVDMPSASQYGDERDWNDEFHRLRLAPEVPPTEALRESNLLERLLEDFVDERLNLSNNQVWMKYAQLLVMLTIQSPYEMLLKWYEENETRKLMSQGMQGVWRYNLMPSANFYDTDDEDEVYNEEDEYSETSGTSDESEDDEMLDDLFEKPEHHLPGASFRNHMIRNKLEMTYGLRSPRLVPVKNETVQGRWDKEFPSNVNNEKKGIDEGVYHDIMDEYGKKEVVDVQSNNEKVSSCISFGDSSSSNESCRWSERGTNSVSSSSYLSGEWGNYEGDRRGVEGGMVYDKSEENRYCGYNRRNERGSESNMKGGSQPLYSEVMEGHRRMGRENVGIYGSGKDVKYLHPPSVTSYEYKEPHISRLEGDRRVPPHELNTMRMGVQHTHPQSDATSMIEPFEVASSIFKNVKDNKKLSTMKMTRKKAKKMRLMFRRFKDEADRYRSVARKELFEIYSITRDRSIRVNAKLYLLKGVASTNIAASATLKYCEYKLLHTSADPLLALSDAYFVLLKYLCDRNASKRPFILLLLKKMFEYGGEFTDVRLSQLHTQKRRNIIAFFVYLLRFEGESKYIISVVNILVDKMDHSLARLFLLLLLKCCGPPYASEFCRPLLQMLQKFVNLSIVRFGDDSVDTEQRQLVKLMLQFLKEAEHCDQPKATPIDIIEAVQMIKKCISDATNNSF